MEAYAALLCRPRHSNMSFKFKLETLFLRTSHGVIRPIANQRLQNISLIIIEFRVSHAPCSPKSTVPAAATQEATQRFRHNAEVALPT